MGQARSGLVIAAALMVALWSVNLIWLRRDTRPPAWDMALHQTYALNYYDGIQGRAPETPVTSWSGNYPPFVHATIALFYTVLHPGPHVASLVNLPASLLLFWSLYMLAAGLAGERAARWTCLLAALAPFLIWMSRESVLDYWLSAWVVTGFFVLRRTEGFKLHFFSLLFGLVCGLGMLTKWFYAAFLFFPVIYVAFRFGIWRERKRLLHFAEAVAVTLCVAGIWYLPNFTALSRYFFDNAQIGALEGEPDVLSFQSWIYYLRLLEGYQLFALLFVVLLVSLYYVWKRRLVTDGGFLAAAVCGGWLAMTLLRTKDPRFTMPLLGPMLILAGAWLASLRDSGWKRICVPVLVSVLVFQAYLANFGVRRLPQQVILMKGYSGSVRWDWNLYLQNYFNILGPPRREDWKLVEILRRVSEHEGEAVGRAELALIPDLPRFNDTNFNLIARLRGWDIRTVHLKPGAAGLQSFDGFRYAVMTERQQGVSWTTEQSRGLNKIIVDAPDIFQLLGTYSLPDGNSARLYYIRPRSQQASGEAAADMMIGRAEPSVAGECAGIGRMTTI